MFQNTAFYRIRVSIFVCVIAVSLSSSIQGQTVGDTFIDTSEWVQSSSPIRTDGVMEGYITETIVRGYRGPEFDRYYNPNVGRNAVEFSTESKIQPVVYENSDPVDRTSLEPPIRPTPDPVIQAANENSSSIYQPNVRGYSNPSGNSQAGFYQPARESVNGYLSGQHVPGRFLQTGYVPTIVPQPNPAYRASNGPMYYPSFNPYAGTSIPFNDRAPGYNTAVYNSSNDRTNRNYVSTQVTTPPTAYTSTLTNCCDPVYRQAQFVSPNVNSGAGTLRTYPQYNGNPYPRPGYGISQPYVRDTWVPILPLRQMPYGSYLGQGIIGQPVAYVDGEPVRNFLRYVFP